MSVREKAPTTTTIGTVQDTLDSAMSADAPLGEGRDVNIVNPDHPLQRTIVVSIKSSMNEFCLQKSRATWMPPAEAIKSICALPPAQLLFLL